MSSATATATATSGFASATSSSDPYNNVPSSDDLCWGLSCSSQWEWARWVIFVVFMVILLAFIITTVRINHLRRKRGQQPLRYVSWLTPPTYRQSEGRRSRNAVPAADYVPAYTEEANENDLGYYDAQGIFHVNSKAQPPPPIDAHVVEHRNERGVDLEMQDTIPGPYASPARDSPSAYPLQELPSYSRTQEPVVQATASPTTTTTTTATTTTTTDTTASTGAGMPERDARPRA